MADNTDDTLDERLDTILRRAESFRELLGKLDFLFNNAGTGGARDAADGVTAGLTLAHPQSGDDLGWRVQAWLRNTGFSNTSATMSRKTSMTWVWLM